jgi:hypothetical protein
VLQIYSASATRLLSFLPVVAPGAIVFLATAADVLFWLIRSEHGAKGGIAQECRGRFIGAYNDLKNSGNEIGCVVGYSQGSVVAIDAMAVLGASERMVTIGSPICSLYRDFLGIELGRGSDLEGRWTNFYRTSDYIGGSVPWAAGGDHEILSNFAMNHMTYFVEAVVHGAIEGLEDAR